MNKSYLNYRDSQRCGNCEYAKWYRSEKIIGFFLRCDIVKQSVDENKVCDYFKSN